jgi:uncharacterized protein YndB with AHSA1/START domain
MAKATEKAVQDGFDLAITRIFDAPRSLVFKVWSTPEHLMRWWGPKDFACTLAKTDFREGGAWRTSIRSPEGTDHGAQGVYREIIEPERLVFTFAWDESSETLVTVTFEDHDGRTKLTFRQTPFDTIESRDSHQEGWSECLDRLEAYLATAPAA